MTKVYSESMFIDSGAHTLYNVHVLKHKKTVGKTGRQLDRPDVIWGKGDFGYYDLRKGRPFRKYCDRYASFMKRIKELCPSILLANVDAISSPELTWQIQKFFEDEHGVSPVPIIHFATPMSWVDRYVEGKYDLLGVGGLGQGVSRNQYFNWGDEFFSHICPKSNGYLPVIKTHGFAMTSWELICRWPWWSVDSATWVKLSAYGWLYVPRWTEEKGFRFDKTPMMINFSMRPPKESKTLRHVPVLPDQEENTAPREKERMKHFNNITEGMRVMCLKWLERINLPLGKIDREGTMIEFGVTSHHRARSIANLKYLKELEQSRPPWPHPLDPSIVRKRAVHYVKGLGF